MTTQLLPPQADVEWALLRLLGARGKPITAQEAYDALAEHFELGWVATHLRRPNASRDVVWPNVVRFARRRLVDEGWMLRNPRNQWQLSVRGKARAAIKLNLSSL